MPTPATADSMCQTAVEQAEQSGVSPIAYHVGQWAEEVDEYTLADNRLMIEAANRIYQYELEAAAPGDAAHENH